jgi:hypothetical protein
MAMAHRMPAFDQSRDIEDQSHSAGAEDGRAPDALQLAEEFRERLDDGLKLAEQFVDHDSDAPTRAAHDNDALPAARGLLDFEHVSQPDQRQHRTMQRDMTCRFIDDTGTPLLQFDAFLH